MRPDPYYESHVTPYHLDHQALESFLDVQTSVKANTKQASSLLEVATTRRRGFFGKLAKGALAVGGAMLAGRMARKVVGGGGGGDKAGLTSGNNELLDIQKNDNGWSSVVNHPPTMNPASFKLLPLDGTLPDFKRVPNRLKSTGSFPGSQHYRRGQYGWRRRRIPYFTNLPTKNPYRRPNNFFTSPNDFLKSKDWMNSDNWDYGQIGSDSNKLPYGGFSSFRHARFRSQRHDAAVGAPNFGDSPAISAPSGFLSNGSRAPSMGRSFGSGAALDPFRGGSGMRWNGEMFEPTRHPQFGGPSPYIQGMEQFFNFYSDDGAAGGEGALQEASA